MRVTEGKTAAAQAPFDVFVIDEEIIVHDAVGIDIGARYEHRCAADEAETPLYRGDIRDRLRGLILAEQSSAAQPGIPFDASPGLHQSAGNRDQAAPDDAVIALL